MNLDNINEIFAIANEAKSCGYYPIANAAFTALVQLLERGESGLEVELQTQDTEGAWVNQAWFDLLVLRGGEPEQELCIPVPLLTPFVVCSLMKRAKIIMIYSDERRPRPEAELLTEAECRDLWRRLREVTEAEGLALGGVEGFEWLTTREPAEDRPERGSRRREATPPPPPEFTEEEVAAMPEWERELNGI